MTQMCRYCAYCSYGDVPYCSVRGKVLSEAYAKHSNKCKHFDFCEIDVFGETDGYKPRQKREVDDKQIRMMMDD